MTPLALAVSKALIHFLWQGSVVGLSLGAVLFALRRKSASSRYASSCAAFAVLAVLPLVTTVVLYTGSVGEGERPATGVSAPLVSINGAVSVAGESSWLMWVLSWVLRAWSIGVVIFAARFVIGWRHASQLRRAAASAGESLLEAVSRIGRAMRVDRPIQVLVSPMSDSPSVVGWVRPAILLPAATLTGLTPFQLEAILAHEIGHIKRYDYLVNMLQMAVETLLFYHPAVWWTSRRIRVERELCCDDLAVSFSGNPLGYARALTTLEKLRLRAPRVAMASTGGPLMYRIQRLMGVAGNEYGSSRLPLLATAALGFLCLTFNVDWIRGQDAPGVTVDLRSANVVHREPVGYPETAQKRGVTGIVQVEVKLDPAGNVSDARVITGPEELRKAALQSVLNWHFTSDAARETRVVAIEFSSQEPRVESQETVQPLGGELLKSENKLAKLHELLEHSAFELKNRKAEIAEQIEASKLHFPQELVRTDIEALRRKLEEIAVARESVAEDRRALERGVAELEAEFRARQRESESNAQANLSDRRVLEERLATVQAEFLAMQERRKALEEAQKGISLNGLDAQRKLAGLQAELRRMESQGSFANRPLGEILTPGLSESVRNELIARLPIRLGDVITPEKADEIRAAVRAFDEHLTVQFTVNDSQSQLRISPPR